MDEITDIIKYHYRFYVYAITGPKGHCDSDDYLSDKYYDDEECRKWLRSFQPCWLHIRAVKDKQIIKYNDKTGEEISRYNHYL